MNDPVRLLDDPQTSPELRSLLAAARGDVLDRAAVVRVQARAQANEDGPAMTSGRRRWWGIGVGTAAIVGWLALRDAATEPPRELAAAAPLSRSASAPVDDDGPAAVAPVVATPTPVPIVEADAAPDTASSIDHGLAPRAREPRRSARTAASASPPASSVPASSASEEARLLLAARRSLARDPATALAHTEEHARRFAQGALAEERELVAVRALVALDRRSEAQARAERFAERFPGSVHRSALEHALE